MRVHHLLPLIVAWNLAAAEVRLTSEQPLGPQINESQRNVQVVRAVGHRFAAWRDNDTNFFRPSRTVDGSFDGTMLSFARSDVMTKQPLLVPRRSVRH